MLKLVVTRALHALVVVFLVATITFVLVHIAPGEPFAPNLESTRISQEALELQRERFGLDRPLPIQYGRYLASVARGDFGISFRDRRPVLDAIWDKVPNTLLLAFFALLLDFGLGIATGVWQATHRGSIGDRTLSIVGLTLYSTPVFWLGLMLIMLFAVALDWLPVSGTVTVGVYDGLTPLGQLLDRARHLILPAATLGLVGFGGTARYQRSAMVETLQRDFIRAARARGIPERIVILRHALRNSLLSVLTVFGMAFPVILSGSVLVEQVFGWPGMGKFAFDAVMARDYPIVVATAIIAAIMVVAGNLMADLSYRLIDPRTREDGS